MPHDSGRQSPDLDRLSRKIERLLAGQPSEVLDNDTEELAEIARMLNAHLPKDIPDPGFREQLKKDLIDPGPRLVTLPPRRSGRRYPVPVFAGALAVVMLATAATGWMAFGPGMGTGGGDDSPIAFQEVSAPATASATAAAASVTAIETARQNNRESSSAGADSGPENDPSPTATPSSEPTRIPNNTPGASGEPNTSTPPQQPGEPVEVANLPPVDGDHVELGALATIESGERTKLDDIDFELDTELPEMETSAPAYHFATPFVDPRMILKSVGQFLGIDEEPSIEDDQGRTMYKLGSEAADTTFTWFPSSGAFSCTIKHSEPGSQVEDISAAAIEWLRDFGFPVNSETVRPVIKTNTDGERTVEVPLGEMPDPAIGHPMSVSLVVDEFGRITRASGYWIQVTDITTTPLLSASESWDALERGIGYWPDRPDNAAGGQFSVNEFGVSYVLTIDTGNEGLVLQPVVRATGTFRPVDGEPLETSIFLQALAHRDRS